MTTHPVEPRGFSFSPNRRASCGRRRNDGTRGSERTQIVNGQRRPAPPSLVKVCFSPHIAVEVKVLRPAYTDARRATRPASRKAPNAKATVMAADGVKCVYEQNAPGSARYSPRRSAVIP